MPYKDKKNRREWERSPEQVEAARVRKERQRARMEKIERLQAVASIIDRAGPGHSIAPALVAEVEKHREEIEAFWQKRDSEAVQVFVDGKRVRDNHAPSRTLERVGGVA